MENKIETWLPLFSGFYNTLWDGDDELDNYCCENDVNSDEVEVDWNEYRKDVAIALVNEMQNDLIKLGLIYSIEFQQVISPTYYNFENDSINVFIAPNADAIRNYIHQHMSEFDAYVRANYTSYDGFSSSYPNTSFDWGMDTDNFNVLDNDKHTLGCLLDFILKNEQIEEFHYYSAVVEQACFDEYCTFDHTPLQNISNFDDRVTIIKDNIEDIDLEHGYLGVLSAEARAKSILLGTDFVEELVETAYGELIDALPFDKVNKELESR